MREILVEKKVSVTNEYGAVAQPDGQTACQCIKMLSSEYRLNQLFDSLPDATFIIDTQERVIVWNRAIAEMTGIPACRMVGKSAYEYALPFYGCRMPILINFVLYNNIPAGTQYQCIRREGDSLIAETDQATLCGRPVHLWGKASPIHDAHGRIIGAVETIRNVSEYMNISADGAAGLMGNAQVPDSMAELLHALEAEKRQLHEQVRQNVAHVLLPIIMKLQLSADEDVARYARILEQQIYELTVSFADEFSLAQHRLSSREMEICVLIKHRMSTKEIAELLHISTQTVAKHRKHIRKKLRLSSQSRSLSACLHQHYLLR